MKSNMSFPDYDSLPFDEEAGKRTARGIWDGGKGTDHLGALNHLTPDSRLAAIKEVLYGKAFQLDWSYHKIGKPPFGRNGLQQKVINFARITGQKAHDDEITLNTQSGSQWDGFMHFADQKTGVYYNGVKHSDNVTQEEHAHSVHYWCKEGIVGRGVLLDWRRWREVTGLEVLQANTFYGITVEELKSVAARQGTTFSAGDILIIRTGFVNWANAASEVAKEEAFSKLTFVGVSQGEDIQRWLWNNRFAAVAGDSMGWEAFPPPESSSALHEWLLPHAGIPIGELWDLEALSEECAHLKKWSFLLTSAPINVKGGVASPANAIALL